MKLQLVAAAAAAALLLGSTATAGVDGREQSVRVERFFKQGPEAEYSFDSGTILQRPLGKVRTPPTDRVDVVVTMSFEYKITNGAMGTMALLFDDQPGAPQQRLRPHDFTFASEGSLWGATTLQWFRRDLPGSGRVYYFEAFANLDRQGSVEDASILTRNLVVTIDVRPSD